MAGSDRQSLNGSPIRFAHVDDAPAIARVHVATWRAAYAGIMPPDFLAALSEEQRAADWRRGITMDPERVLLWEEDGRLFGWVAFGRARNRSTETLEVYALYVLPTDWGRGVGTALMRRAEEVLQRRGCRRIVLWVLEKNDQARGFYERLGYRLTGEKVEEEFGGVKLVVCAYDKPIVPAA